MNLAEVEERISRWEDLHTEFKEWPVHPDDLAASLVAFANTDGGQLILGVSESREIKGVQDPDRVARDVDNVAANNCEPPITVIQETLRCEDGSTVVVINVPKGDMADGRTSLLTVPLSLDAAGAEDHIDALFLPTAGDPWILVRPAEAEMNLHGRSVVPAAQAALPASGEAQILVVGHGLADEGGALRGRILDARGRPAAGGELELLAVTRGESGEPDLIVGRLSAGSLPPGSYLLELRLGYQDPSQPRPRAVTARPFRVAAAVR